MDTIKTNIDKLLIYRSEKNKELFINSLDGNTARLYIQADTGIVLYADISRGDSRLSNLLNYVNNSLNLESLMLETHDFGNISTWPLINETPDSMFTLTPYAGYKLIVTSIVTRFPDNVDLATNPINFTLYKHVEPYGVIPVVVDTYNSIESLLCKSNSPWYSVELLNNAFTNKMIEVKFRYADSDENNWSKLTLHENLGEKIEVTVTGNTPIKAVGGADLSDPCYAFFNTKRVLDF